MTCKVYLGDCREVMKTLQKEKESVDLVVTSPPYWGLRDYKTEPVVWDGRSDSDCKHEWCIETNAGDIRFRGNSSIVGNNANPEIWNGNGKGHFCSLCGAWRGQLGLEPNPEFFIKHLLDVFDLVKSVLKDTGCVFVNLGDTYSNSGSNSQPTHTSFGRLTKAGYKTKGHRANGLPPKCLCMIPQRFAWGMIEHGWILRNVIIWHKVNCLPSSARDRFTVDFEYLFFFTKSKNYYFEQQFEPYDKPLNRWGGETLKRDTSKTAEYKKVQKIGYSSAFRVGRPMRPNPVGRNKRCVWTIPTKPFPEAHFAVYPEELIKTPIKAGCPESICRECGKPRLKIYAATGNYITQSGYGSKTAEHIKVSPTSSLLTKKVQEKTFAGYYDCGCNAGWDAGVVLDPFAGSGTTLKVAKELGRDAIGIEINPTYVKIIQKRLNHDCEVIDLREG